MKNNKLLIGLAGEYFVAGMMNMKGWVASLTLKNYPSVDIFGLNPETEKNINVQVKTTKCNSSYQVGLMRSQRDIIKNKIKSAYVFVHIDKAEHVRYFILSKEEVTELIITTDNIYYNKPRKKTIAEDYPMAIYLKDLIPFENKWDSLWI